MSDKGYKEPEKPAPKVKRMRSHPIRDNAVGDFHLAASVLWSVHQATCDGGPAYDSETLIRMTEAILHRVWLDGHTHGVFTARKMGKP